jgi:hypothetical protein
MQVAGSATAAAKGITPTGKPSATKKGYDYFTSIDLETRSHVPTDTAAYYLNRQPQTMRAWACLENGPIRPTRINGRLAWSIFEIKRLLNGGQQ